MRMLSTALKEGLHADSPGLAHNSSPSLIMKDLIIKKIHRPGILDHVPKDSFPLPKSWFSFLQYVGTPQRGKLRKSALINNPNADS
jgi:hypothetical protein